jgi:hypothetical protein
VQILQRISRELYEVLPEVSTALNKVNDTIAETLSVTKMTADESLIPVNLKTPAGEEILKEVSNFLEEQVAEKLPEPPASLPTSEKEAVQTGEVKRMVALAAVCSQSVGQQTEITEEGELSPKSLFSFKDLEVQKVSLTIEPAPLEDVVFEYVKKRKGQIDLVKCSQELNIPYDEIKNALKSLGEKGKILIKR